MKGLGKRLGVCAVVLGSLLGASCSSGSTTPASETSADTIYLPRVAVSGVEPEDPDADGRERFLADVDGAPGAEGQTGYVGFLSSGQVFVTQHLGNRRHRFTVLKGEPTADLSAPGTALPNAMSARVIPHPGRPFRVVIATDWVFVSAAGDDVLRTRGSQPLEDSEEVLAAEEAVSRALQEHLRACAINRHACLGVQGIGQRAYELYAESEEARSEDPNVAGCRRYRRVCGGESSELAARYCTKNKWASEIAMSLCQGGPQ